MSGDLFTCADCRGTFSKVWSDEEAEAEALVLWGAVPANPVVVCDDCFAKYVTGTAS